MSNFLAPHSKADSFSCRVKAQCGFTLTSTLMAVGITSLTFMAVMGMINFQGLESKAIKQQLVRSSAHYHILQSLINEGNCKCLMSSHQITDKQQQYDLKTIYSSYTNSSACTSDASNIIVTSESTQQKNEEGLSIASVVLDDVTKGGSLGPIASGSPSPTYTGYQGKIIITYNHQYMVRVLKPITIPILLTVDSSGSPGNVRVCGAKTDLSGVTARVVVMEEQITGGSAPIANPVTPTSLTGRVIALEKRVTSLVNYIDKYVLDTNLQIQNHHKQIIEIFKLLKKPHKHKLLTATSPSRSTSISTGGANSHSHSASNHGHGSHAHTLDDYHPPILPPPPPPPPPPPVLCSCTTTQTKWQTNDGRRCSLHQSRRTCTGKNQCGNNGNNPCEQLSCSAWARIGVGRSTGNCGR